MAEVHYGYANAHNEVLMAAAREYPEQRIEIWDLEKKELIQTVSCGPNRVGACQSRCPLSM
jgi:hypothetical protein